MNAKEFNKYLKSINACQDAVDWANGQDFDEIWSNCHRGDWMLWLYKKACPDDFQGLTLAIGHCVNTVRHFMKDERSIAAVDASIAFGEGKISLQTLNAAVSAAYKAYEAAAAAAAAKKKNQKETADICRKYLKKPIFKIKE